MTRDQQSWFLRMLLPFCVFLTLPLSGTLYYLTNQDTVQVYNFSTRIDEWIPFLKVFILPYMIWYPFVYISLFVLMVRNRKLYYKFMLVLNLCFVVCFYIYTQYQTTFIRPVATGTDWLSWMVQLVQTYDQPYNCFPSLHVVTSYLVVRAYAKSSGFQTRTRLLVYGIGISIILSTLFVKQHVLMDVIGGIGVVEVMVGLVTVVERLRLRQKKATSTL